MTGLAARSGRCFGYRRGLNSGSGLITQTSRGYKKGRHKTRRPLLKVYF